MTNKIDASGITNFVYQYDPLDRLTNRWSIAKSNTVYNYDPIGNLTNVVYLGGASSTSPISFSYDGLNRLTNMLDGVGSTAFSWTAGDQLAAEDGPWVNDTVNYTYNGGRQRVGLAVQAPNASAWKQSYAWDSKLRLTQVLSPASQFSYTYPDDGDHIYQLFLTADGTTYIQNYFGFMGQVAGSALMTPQGEAGYFGYVYDQGMKLTQKWFTAGNYMTYTYDNIGQLKSAQGWESDATPRLQEQFGYGYDKTWNLNQRTNNALVETFNVNNLNELTIITNQGTLTVAGTATEYSYYLTGVTVSGTGLSSGSAELYGDGTWARANATPANGNNTYTAIANDTYGRWSTNSVTVNLPATNTCSYDLNGNLLSDGTRCFEYDDENQLVSVTVSNVWRSEYVYDGLLRRRISREYTWAFGSWMPASETRYVYDGNLVLQERNQNNTPLVTYTRGNDLSGTLQGAGGIGGLLARTDMGLKIEGSSQASAFYFCDVNGNITELVNTNGLVMASYKYDPFGNIISMSGPLASANSYRFSSKEWNDHAGDYYYGYRFYEPNLQRWLNRDPIQESGGLNLYGIVGNNSINSIDLFGLYNPISGPNGPVGPGSGAVDPTAFFPSLPPPPYYPTPTYPSPAGNDMMWDPYTGTWEPVANIRTDDDPWALVIGVCKAPRFSLGATPESIATSTARKAAVREAWKQEADMVRRAGQGTRNWTSAQKQELLNNGKVKGYEGHHINSVADNPGLAGNPDNVQFVTRPEHFGLHDYNWQNQTCGSLLNRN